MKRLFAAALAFLLVLSGCAAPEGEMPASVKELTAEYEPASSGSSEADAAALNAFAAKLFAAVTSRGEENPVVSPLSAYLALGMAAAGAQDGTLDEFETLLGSDISDACRALIVSLTDTAGDTALNIADSAWADEEATIYAEYLQQIADSFSAEVYSAKLSSDDARRAVNAWIAEKTEGMIPEMNKENFSEDAVLVLVNTVYLMAKWQNDFRPQSTGERKFAAENGSIVTAEFLNDYLCGRDYIKTDTAEGVYLPYNDGKTAFIAMRPTNGDSVRDFAASLTGDSLLGYAAAAERVTMNLSLPRFTSEYEVELSDVLSALGLSSAFDVESADFSAMGESENGNIFISKVLQKVKLTVDEEGTEASAATEVEMADGAALADPVELILDSPFVYAVIDTATGAPLFMGLMSDPTL